MERSTAQLFEKMLFYQFLLIILHRKKLNIKKIEIHNFGPIKDAVINIKPMLVIIGQQASGKSTIAKLIYFFETIQSDFFQGIISLNWNILILQRI